MAVFCTGASVRMIPFMYTGALNELNQDTDSVFTLPFYPFPCSPAQHTGRAFLQLFCQVNDFILDLY